MTHILSERLKELDEDAEREKALKDVANDNAKEKSKAIEVAEKKAQSSKKARQLAKKRRAEVESWLEGIELKLAEANSLNLAQADQIADLKVALEACENKWYGREICRRREVCEACCSSSSASWVRGGLASDPPGDGSGRRLLFKRPKSDPILGSFTSFLELGRCRGRGGNYQHEGAGLSD